MSIIRDLRKDLGLSQKDLAAKLNGKVSQSAISMWEKGKTNPRPELVEELSHILGVTPDRLMEPEASKPEGECMPEVEPQQETVSCLSAEEGNLLDLFRGSDGAGRKVIMAVAEIEYNRRRAELLKE